MPLPIFLIVRASVAMSALWTLTLMQPAGGGQASVTGPRRPRRCR